MQLAGGMSYALGYAKDSIGLAKFGSTLGEIGGAAGQAIAWVDIYRDMSRKFDPNAPPQTDVDALESGLKVAGAIFPELALHAIVFHYGVRPVAEATADFATPIFSGAIKQIYGWPPTF
jgi:hypothetical protein